MAKSFRDLEIWQEGYELAIGVYNIAKNFPKEEIFSLVDQVKRSSVSVCANIAESFGRYHVNDKIQLLIVARGSIYETMSHLTIAFGLRYIHKERA